MYDDNKMRFLSLRHMWVVLLAWSIFIIATLTAFIGSEIFNLNEDAFQSFKHKVVALMAFCFYLFIVGLNLVIFFPKWEHRNLFKGYHKLMIIAFSISAASFVFIPPILNMWPFGKFIFNIGGGLMLIGVFQAMRASRE